MFKCEDLMFQLDLSDDEDEKPIKKQTNFLKKGKLVKDLKKQAEKNLCYSSLTGKH